MNALFLVQLVVYILLCPPILYIWYRHGWFGILAWGYLAVFCAFRIIGGGLAINGTGTGPAILADLGIGPLLLAVNGILDEARLYRKPNQNKCLRGLFLGVMTGIMAAGIAEAGTGAAALGGSNPSSDDVINASIGIGLLFATWVLLVTWGLFQLKPTQHRRDAIAFREGTLLLHAIFASLFFVGVRVSYGLVAVATKKEFLNPITGSLAVRVLLSFLPELITSLILIFAGLKTQEVGQIAKAGYCAPAAMAHSEWSN